MDSIPYTAGGLTLELGKVVVVSLKSRVWRGRLRGLLFDPNKSFLLPGAIPAMRKLKDLYDAHPGVQVLVTGHTDRTADDSYNLRLSAERAQAIAAYLRDQVAAWTPWYEPDILPDRKRWGTREDQEMLSVVGDEGGPFYKGPITGAEDAATHDALRAFQEWSTAHGTPLAAKGAASRETRRELVRAYMAQPGTTLPEGTVLQTHGCGPFHNAVDNPPGEARDDNRRVEIFFFDGAIAPPPRATCPGGGCPEYPQWVAAATDTIDLSGGGASDKPEGYYEPCTETAAAPAGKPVSLGIEKEGVKESPAGIRINLKFVPIAGVKAPPGVTLLKDSEIVLRNWTNFDTDEVTIKATETASYQDLAKGPIKSPMKSVKSIVLHESVAFGSNCISHYPVHFFIAENGTIYQCTDLAERTNHVGDSLIHAESISIEFANIPYDAKGLWKDGTVPDNSKKSVTIWNDLKKKYESHDYAGAQRERLFIRWKGQLSPTYQLVTPLIDQLERLVWLVNWLCNRPLGTDGTTVPLQWRNVWPPMPLGPKETTEKKPTYFVPLTQSKPLPDYYKHIREPGVLSHSIAWPMDNNTGHHADGAFLAIYTWLRLGVGMEFSKKDAFEQACDIAGRVPVATSAKPGESAAALPTELHGQSSTDKFGVEHPAGGTTALRLWPKGFGTGAKP